MRAPRPAQTTIPCLQCRGTYALDRNMTNDHGPVLKCVLCGDRWEQVDWPTLEALIAAQKAAGSNRTP